MKITVRPRSSKPSKWFPLTVDLPSKAPTVGDLKQAIASKSKLSIYRQRITTSDKKVLDDASKTLKEVGVTDGETLEIKDLGPQISWRTVFLIEYFGPLFIHPFFFYAQKLVYGKTFKHSKMQEVALLLILAHYVKREFETIFVHRFSSATMPIMNVFRNSGHYWGLSGLLLAVPLYGPWNSYARLAGTVRSQNAWIYGWSLLWLIGQVSNAITHLNLRSLRAAGSKTRAIPRGYGFNLVSCPNYFFESVVWTAFTFLTLDYAAAFFSVVATSTMLAWALKKQARYKKEFGKDYPRGRKAMFPFII